MKVLENGSKIVLEHCIRLTNDFRKTDGMAIIHVDGLDGEQDFYHCKPADFKKAVAELTAYYARDWAGTGRVFAYRVYSPTYDGVLPVRM
jgi:hypothetical protein